LVEEDHKKADICIILKKILKKKQKGGLAKFGATLVVVAVEVVAVTEFNPVLVH
jgi:hypothetical protein